MNDPSPILLAEALHKSFGRGATRNHVLRGATLTIRRGEFVSIMGPSGCGKSTLLHLLGLMSRPDEGRLFLNQNEATTHEATRHRLRRHEIGFVFQRFNLLGMLNGWDNVRISLKVRGLLNGQSHCRIGELFEQMEVSDAATRKPGQMSIGEQQRIAVARAMAHRPSLLLADEPTGNLDSRHSHDLLELFRDINRQDGQTIVMITHSSEAAEKADRILQMTDGQIHDRQS